jgi:hypothetical protein
MGVSGGFAGVKMLDSPLSPVLQSGHSFIENRRRVMSVLERYTNYRMSAPAAR